MANARKNKPQTFIDAPEVQISLGISLEDVDVVRIASGTDRVLLNTQEASMLHEWLTRALGR